MTGTARAIALAFAALLAVGGLALFSMHDGGGIGLLIMAALITSGVVFERRYKRPGTLSSGQAGSVGQWQPTGERFIDDESGEPVEVWSDPLTGERRYEPIGRLPHQP
ncbi:hypothetical protein [Novosphingobium lentum]|uniref:hypothetical protein n=1 Tax=Novosphingobium lentum TaxID=145287 RepID=UPI000830C976|nr:hypothetical protein [Novosphingobium lentum]